MRNFALTMVLSFAMAGCERLIDPSNENAADYLPIKAGAQWEYYYNGPYAYGMELVAGADTLINGKIYSTQRSETWSDAVNIYRFSGEDIYEIDWKFNEELVFKMAPVGSAWSSRIQFDSVNYSIIRSSVAAKGLTMEVYGNTFTNVIQIRSLVTNYYENGTTGEYIRSRYFAKGIGIIKEGREDEYTGFHGLKSYSIK